MHTSIIPHGGLSKRKTTTIVDRTTSSIITNTSKYGSNDLSSPKSFGSRCGDHPKDLDKGGRKVLNSLQLFKTDVIRILKSKKIVLVAGLYCTILLTAKYVEDVKLGRRIHPKVVGCYFAPEGNAMLKIRRLPVYDEDRYPSKRTVVWSDQDEEAENKLRNSRKYNRARAEMRDDDECSLPYDWQKKSYPTCNNIHENDMTQFFNEGEHKVEERLLLLDHGFFRDIWTFKPHDGGTTMVLKTLREIHELTDRNFDRHRRDALVMEHLTSSNHSAQIYSFCGNSIHSEFATMGTVSDLIWPLSGENSTMTSFDRLQLALKVAQAVNDVHMYDEQGLATVAHTDITPSQFLVFEDGSIKINDFNRCRFLLRNDRGEICPYKVSHNPGKFRSVSETSLHKYHVHY